MKATEKIEVEATDSAIKDRIKQNEMANIDRKEVFHDTVQMVDDVPLFSQIDINPSELCNRTCEFCPRHDASVYPNRNLHMKVELAEKMASELRSYNFSGSVNFSGFGEPLLHKEIASLVGAFGDDIQTELVTNGDRLNEKIIERLFAAGLNLILVSMYDGPEQADHFTTMLTAAGLREDQYLLRERWYDIDSDFGLTLTNRAGTVNTGRQKAIDVNRPCYYPFYFMQVDWNGDVLLCIQDWHKMVMAGNLETESLLDVWKSEKMNEYRKHLGGGSRCLEPCSECNADGTMQGGNHAEIWGHLLEV